MGLFDLFRKREAEEKRQENNTQQAIQPAKHVLQKSETEKQFLVEKPTTLQTNSDHRVPQTWKANPSTSKDEQYVFYYVKRYFPNAINRHVIRNESGEAFEADVFIPGVNVAIEYDGAYWHKDKYDRDVEKTAFFNSIGIYVIHIRETGLEPLPPFDGLELWHRVGRSKKGFHTNEYISYMLQDLSRFCDGPLADELSVYSLSYEQYCNDLPDINSLIYTQKASNPASSYREFRSWDYEKNGHLNPDNVPWDANIKVFITCPSGQTKHVNVFSVCGSNDRKPFPAESIGGICPYYGRFEICVDRCEYYNQKVIEYINRFTQGKEQLENLPWLRMFVLNDDTILAYIFSLFIKNRMSKAQFEELLLDVGWRKHLLRPLMIVGITSPGTLHLLQQAQKKYNTFSARFDAIRFDVDERSRETLILYLDSLLSDMDAHQRGDYLNELFCVAFQKKIKPSNDIKQRIRTLTRKYQIQGMPPDVEEWLTQE